MNALTSSCSAMLLMMDTSGEMSELRRVSSRFRMSARGLRWIPTQLPALFLLDTTTTMTEGSVDCDSEDT